MSILNVNQLQPIGGGNTITVSASDVNFSGNISIGSSFVGTASTATLATISQGLTGTPDITVNNIQSGVVTATTFIGDGSGITGVTASGSGINIKDSASTVGVAATIDFGTNLNVTPASAGIVTVTVGDTDFEVADKIIHTGDTNTAIRFPAADTVTIETGGTEALRIGSDQKVYFGDFASAGSKAYIEKEVSGDYKLNIHASSSTAQNRIITFNSREDVESMRLDANGRLGIGTNNPDRVLHLAQANSTAYSGTDAFDKDYHVLKLNNTTDDGTVGMQFLIGSNGEAAITASEVAGTATDLIFSTRSGDNKTEKLRIEAAGNIGIGTDNPGELLHMFSHQNLTLKIHTTGPTSPAVLQFKSPNNGRVDFVPDTSGSASGRIMYVHSDDSMRFETDSTEKVRITTNGRLLVGTATTNTAGSYSSVLSTGGSGNNGGFQAHYNAATFGGGSMTTINGGGGGLIFWTYTGNLGSESFTERMRVDSNGYITKPSTPAFLAYHQSSDLNYAVGDTLAYPYTVYNIGNHYNTSNSTFTAPVAGRYLFSINAQANYQSGVSGVPRAYWKINGNNVANAIHLRG